MELIIEIDSEKVHERNITTKEGHELTFREQTGYYHQEGKKFPQEIVLQLEGSNPPYPVGMYDVNADSIHINNFKQLAFGRHLKLSLRTAVK